MPTKCSHSEGRNRFRLKGVPPLPESYSSLFSSPFFPAPAGLALCGDVHFVQVDAS